MAEAPAPLPYPNLQNVFSPRQVHMSDVPYVSFNISDPATALRETNRLRLMRARKIAPALLGERLIPVAPFVNPVYGISNHRIRLHDPNDISRVVELFVRDTDLYFAGFRRGVVAIPADGAAPDEPQWGRLFIFDDLYKDAPPFFEAVKMGVRSDHTNKGDAPGPWAVMALFETFFRFQDEVEIDVDSEGNPQARDVTEDVRKALLIAVATAIILFCEALRLKSIYTPVIEALESFNFAVPLPGRCWKLIRWWGQLCDEVLSMRQNHTMALETDLPRRNYTVVGIDTLGHLIGQDGELSFCKSNKSSVIMDEVMRRLENEAAAVNVVDPTFEEEQAAAQAAQAAAVAAQAAAAAAAAGGARGRGGRGRRGRGRGRGGRG